MTPARFRRARWFLGAALAPVLWPALAYAAPTAPGALLPAAQAPAAVAPPAGSDGLEEKEVYLEADQLIDDREHKLVIAQGHVEARVDGRTVRADKLTYDTATGASRAVGHAILIQADGTQVYGDEVELDDKLRAGVAMGFAARLQKNVTIAAAAVIRRSESVNELRNAVYTPCDLCKADGVTPKTPTYDIRASRIVEDKEHQLVYFENAVIRVKGVPVLFLPFFFTPDPTAERHSGFLPPRLSVDQRRGFSYEQPYYWAISPSQDLTASLQVNANVDPLLQLQYRQRFTNGYLDVRGGYTHEQLFDNDGRYGDDTHRSFILANGRFTFGPEWDAGFGLERVTDPTLFRRYDVRSVFSNRGLNPADTDRLVSQAFVERTDPTSYLSVSTISFQSLRAYGQDALGRPTFESNKAFPVVAPLIEARWDPKEPVFGGRLRLRASAVVLSRNDDVVSVFDPTGVQPLGPQRLQFQLDSPLPAGSTALSYQDSRRASLRGEWRRDFFLSNGIRLQPLAEVRGDLYSIGSGVLTTSNGLFNANRAADAVTAIAQGTVGFTASWPLIRNVGTSSIILEPIVQVLASPNLKPDRNIPNEDSVAFEFDDTTLFAPDRFPGFDLYESGARFNIGARANLLWGPGHSANLTVGRVYRTEPDPAFTIGSGLSGRTSDYVAFAQVSPFTGTNFFLRTRLDSETLNVRRSEGGLDVGFRSLQLGLRYLYNESGFFIDNTGVTQIGRVEDATISGSYFVTKNWGVTVNATRDLKLKTWPAAQVGLVYRDECLRLDLIYTRDETYRAAIGASDSIAVRLTLATLGDTGSPFRPNISGR